MMEKLWGDNYFNKKEMKWTSNNETKKGKKLDRCFVKFIMNPIIKLTTAVIEGDEKKMNKMLKACNVELTKTDKEKEGKKLLKIIM